MKTFWKVFVALVILGAGGFALYRYLPGGGETETTSVRTDTAKIRDLESVVTATGEVLPLLSSVVKSEISGRITKVEVDEGDPVERGQLLLELDRTSLETRVREAERSVEAEQLRLEKAERNFKRLKQLFEKDFVGEREFLDAETDYDLAKLNLEIARARLEDAQEDLSKTSILAPHDGIVTRLDVVEGQVISGATSVSEGTELLTVAELEELYMEADINEVDVEKLDVGDDALLRFDAIPGFTVEGTINKIALSARADGNVRVFPIEVVFESEDARVRPGISATVEIPVASVDDAVSVLLSAVFVEDGDSFVYLRRDGDWVRQAVETGINDLQHVAIESGLAEEDTVALTRPAAFRENGDE